MVHWSSNYEKVEGGCRIDYSGLGSGGGIKGILDDKVDFSCTDAPLTDGQMAKARESGGEVLHIPIILGAVVPVYNLPEVSEPLRFSGPVLADIYLGKVKRWNDPALKQLNPQAADRLPDQEIAVVHRSDESGTTFIWADYLAKVSADWKIKMGVGTELTWPVGGGGEPGSDGVGKRVKKIPHSVGYLELSYACRLELQTALVQNREKEFIKAGLTSVQATADNGLTNLPHDLRYSITDPPGKGSYPICGTTWVIVRNRPPAGKARQLKHFLAWATSEGQEEAEMLLYLRLPDRLLDRARDQIKLIKSE
jgi:phosphate transport system substrate-binding protein